MTADLKIIDRPSPNFGARDGPIDLVVLHYTGMWSAEIALDRLTDPLPRAARYTPPGDPPADPDTDLGRVSSHYVVDEAGAIARLVSEDNAAWHAGVSSWKGRPGCNGRSVGIEIVNGGHDFGLPDFPAPQIEAVIALTHAVMARHRIPPTGLVGHSDIAPGRKQDPGEKFPWETLAAAGLGLFPQTTDPGAGPAVARLGDGGAHVAALQEGLASFGYGVAVNGVFDAETADVLRAFHQRFRPGRVADYADEDTLARLNDLLKQMMRAEILRLRS